MDSEKEKLKKLVNNYVILEKKYTHREQEIKFYTICKSMFNTEIVLKKVPEKENQLKQLYEVRKRFFKNYQEKNKDAKDFHSYFYNKFIEEIREVRLQKTGVSFSKRSAEYVDKKIKR